MGCLAKLLGFCCLVALFRALLWLVRELFTDPPRRPHQADATRQHYLRLLMDLLGKIAKADGHVSAREIELVERIFRELNLSGAEQQLAQEAFRAGKEAPEAWVQTAQALARLCAGFELRVITFRYLAYVACAEGRPPPEVLEILLGAARLFGLPGTLVQLILGPMMGQGGPGSSASGAYERQSAASRQAQRERDLALFGLNANASADDIKRAYRRKVKELHPDRLQAQGLPKSLLKQASDRMAELNAAYERLKA